MNRVTYTASDVILPFSAINNISMTINSTSWIISTIMVLKKCERSPVCIQINLFRKLLKYII